MIAATVAHRSQHWDRLRLIAIFDIVAFHVLYRWPVFGVGIPIFLILTLALGGAGAEGTLAEIAKKRFGRLMVPWIFWSIAILLVRLARMAFGFHDNYWSWLMLLYGPWDHLWFLPFAFVASLLLAWIRQQAPAVTTLSLIACGLLSGALIVAPIPEVELAPFRQWLWSLPALPLGFALGRAIDLRGGPRAARHDAAILCAAALAGYALATRIADAQASDALLRYGLAIAALTVVLFIPDTSDRYTRAATPLVFGVYLIHDPLYELGFRRIHVERWFPQEMLQVFLLLLLTTTIVWFLRRSPLQRFL